MNYDIKFTNKIIDFINENESIRSRMNDIIECKDNNELVASFMNNTVEVFSITISSQNKNDKIYLSFEYRGKGISTQHDYESVLVLYNSEYNDACIERGLNGLMNRKPLMKYKEFDSVHLKEYENFKCKNDIQMIVDYILPKESMIKKNKTDCNKIGKFAKCTNYSNTYNSCNDTSDNVIDTYREFIINSLSGNTAGDLTIRDVDLALWFNYISCACTESKARTTTKLFELVNNIYTTLASYSKYSSIDYENKEFRYINTPYCVRSKWEYNNTDMETYILVTQQNITPCKESDKSYIQIDMYNKNLKYNTVSSIKSYRISLDDICNVENTIELYELKDSCCSADNPNKDNMNMMCFINSDAKDILDKDYRCEDIISHRYMFNIVFIIARLITSNIDAMISTNKNYNCNNVTCGAEIPLDIINKYYDEYDNFIKVKRVYDIVLDYIINGGDIESELLFSDSMITMYINELTYKYLYGFINTNIYTKFNYITQYLHTRFPLSYRSINNDDNDTNILTSPLLLNELDIRSHNLEIVKISTITDTAIQIMTDLIIDYGEVKLNKDGKSDYFKGVLNHKISESNSIILGFNIDVRHESDPHTDPLYCINCIVCVYTNDTYLPIIFNKFSRKVMSNPDGVKFIVEMIGQYIVTGGISNIDELGNINIDINTLKRSYCINYVVPLSIDSIPSNIISFVDESSNMIKKECSYNAHKYLKASAEYEKNNNDK